MKKFNILAIAASMTMILSVDSYGGDTHSGRAVAESGKAGSHASAAAGHAVAGSGQATSAASAVPLAIVGSVGAVSAEMAKDLMEAATAPIGTPLEVTDEPVTAGPPPNEALAPKKPKQER